MNKTKVTQEPKRREFFKANTWPLEMKEIRRKVEAMSIEEIQKKLPEELFRAIYRSFLALWEELHSAKTYKQASKIADYFLTFLKNPSFWKTLAYIKEEAEKTKQKDKSKKEKVKWAEK